MLLYFPALFETFGSAVLFVLQYKSGRGSISDRNIVEISKKDQNISQKYRFSEGFDLFLSSSVDFSC